MRSVCHQMHAAKDLVILDELGYLPFSRAGGALLFQCSTGTGGQSSAGADTSRGL
jgi:hypothetical protein